jgi:hypothetical protein
MRFSSSSASINRLMTTVVLIAMPCLGASLSGKVAYRNAPVADASVTLYAVDEAKMTRGATYVTRTGQAGTYNFPSIPNGDYVLIVEKSRQRVYQGKMQVVNAAHKDIELGAKP